MKVKAYTGFYDKKYKPTNEDLVAEFRLEPAKGIDFQTAAEATAGESSIGTWTEISTMKPEIAEKLKPTVYFIDEKSKTARIAYPKDLFEKGNIPQMLSSVAGNIFGMSIVDNLRLEDIDFPDSFVKAHKGPAFGVPGVRKLLKVKDRPLVGTIVKPKVGLDEKEHAKVAYNAWLGGCDVVKDDENLSSMTFNNFDKRIKETLKMKEKVEQETGEKKVYLANVTAESKEMLRRANYVKDLGGETIMVDVLTVGFSALQTLRQEDLGLVLHGHRAMHGAITRYPRHGISMLLIAKLCRLIGIDQLHIGAIVGKMTGSAQEVKNIGEEIENKVIGAKPDQHVLAEDWMNIKPMFAVCSGGLHPGKVQPLMRAMGKDIIIQMGGGIHGHPRGTIEGSKAARQAVDAVLQGIKLEDYAKMHKPLQQAIDKWGVLK